MIHSIYILVFVGGRRQARFFFEQPREVRHIPEAQGVGYFGDGFIGGSQPVFGFADQGNRMECFCWAAGAEPATSLVTSASGPVSRAFALLLGILRMPVQS